MPTGTISLDGEGYLDHLAHPAPRMVRMASSPVFSTPVVYEGLDEFIAGVGLLVDKILSDDLILCGRDPRRCYCDWRWRWRPSLLLFSTSKRA